MLQRFLLPVAAGLLALPVALASAELPETGAAARGINYIRTTQQADGGFSGAQHGAGQTMDAIFAIRSAGIDPATVTKDGVSPVVFLEANVAAVADPASAAKAALAATALGLDPRSVEGTDLLAIIEARYEPAIGRYTADNFSNSLAVLGLECNDVAVPAGAANAIRAAQRDDGGWGFGGSSDPDTAAITLQALIAAGVAANDADVQSAVAYFRHAQGTDGGWGFSTVESNANSTAFVLQALLAAGEDPETSVYLKGGTSPVAYLVALQQADGSFPGFDPAFATNQVVPALMGLTFCESVLAPVGSPAPVPSPPATVAAPLPPTTGTGIAVADNGPGRALLPLAALAVIAGMVALAAARRS